MNHNRETAQNVRVGDLLMPDPAFNRSERPPNHIANPARVVRIELQQSQTGVMLTVIERSGRERTLDAGWFLENNTAQSAPNEELDVARWIVELESDVYLAPWDGDPGRTLVIDNAERFRSRSAAEAALAKARLLKAFKQARCIVAPTPAAV